MNNKHDFDKLFRETYKEQFAESKRYDSFCMRVERAKTGMGNHLLKYVWGPDCFATEKNHPGNGLYRPLVVPEAHKFSDLFQTAKLVESVTKYETLGNGSRRCLGTYPVVDPSFIYVGGTRDAGAAPAGHYGGKRYIKVFKDGSVVRGQSGSKWMATYALPRAGGPQRSYELVLRDDGLLVIGRQEYGEQWLALLDKDETILPLLSPEERDFLTTEAMDDELAWGSIIKDAIGREILAPGIQPGCKVVLDGPHLWHRG